MLQSVAIATKRIYPAARIRPEGVRPRMPRASSKAQFNVRMDADLLGRFREYCERNGLDPAGQIVLSAEEVETMGNLVHV